MATAHEIELAIAAYTDAYDCEIAPAMEAALDAVDNARAYVTIMQSPAGPIPPAGARRWRHKKRGSVIVEIGRGRLQTTPPQYFLADMDEMVIYLHEADGTIWCRARDEFEDGRFEEIAPSPGLAAPQAGAPDHLPRCNCGHLFEICNHPNCPEGTSQQPPALAAAAPDVAGLVERLHFYANNIHNIGAKYVLAGADAWQAAAALTAQAAALAAKAAEISTLKSDLKCETDRYAALVASDSETLTALVERIAALEAALRHVEEALVRDSRTAPVIEFIHVALSGKEPQQP